MRVKAISSTGLLHGLHGRPSDYVLLLLVLLAIGMAAYQLRHDAGSTPMVHIYHAQTLLATYPLQSKQAIHFIAHGDVGTSEVWIERGKVRIIHSSCRTKACVLSGEHHRIGDMIACVPNRILVTIEGKQHALDAISQ